MKRFGIVVSNFNKEITDRLLKSCLKTLSSHGIGARSTQTVRVPGAFELPWAAFKMARTGRYDAVIALGAVLKGQTPQNTFLAQATIEHLQRVSVETGVPCALGVIAPDTYAQALARTKGSLDRGREAALAALELVELEKNPGLRKR